MKLIHHLAVLILPILVLVKSGSARIEPRRVAHLAIRDGPVSRGPALKLRDDARTAAGTWEYEVHRLGAVGNILEPRGRTREEVYSDIDAWLRQSKVLEQDTDTLKSHDAMVLAGIEWLNKQTPASKGRKDVVDYTAVIKQQIFDRESYRQALRVKIWRHLEEGRRLTDHRYTDTTRWQKVYRKMEKLAEIYNDFPPAPSIH